LGEPVRRQVLKWTTQRPTKAGPYWVDCGEIPPHHQGPFVIDVLFEEGDLCVMELAGDYIRTVADYEDQEAVTIHRWSDEPVSYPEDV
jgi:hypothetical protein